MYQELLSNNETLDQVSKPRMRRASPHAGISCWQQCNVMWWGAKLESSEDPEDPLCHWGLSAIWQGLSFQPFSCYLFSISPYSVTHHSLWPWSLPMLSILSVFPIAGKASSHTQYLSEHLLSALGKEKDRQGHCLDRA